MSVPSLLLNDGRSIPQLGLGVWQVPTEDIERVVSEAWGLGYTPIDTAQMYGNEAGVGAAIKALPRDAVFVTTKLGNDAHDPAVARSSLATSLDRMGLDRVDLLIHWPLPTLYDGDYVSTWEALIELQQSGLTTLIGVSNFRPQVLARIVEKTGVAPTVNQIEVHLYFTNEETRSATLSAGALVEGWSPPAQGTIPTDSVVTALAAKYGKPPSQLVLRWHIARGDIVFPKSARIERLEENIDIFDFGLDSSDAAQVRWVRGRWGQVKPKTVSPDRTTIALRRALKQEEAIAEVIRATPPEDLAHALIAKVTGLPLPYLEWRYPTVNDLRSAPVGDLPASDSSTA